MCEKKPESRVESKKRTDAKQKALELLEFDRRFLAEGAPVLAGIDEAGRGPLAGPVVAGAVIVKDADFHERIDDSKKLSALQREKAFAEIIKKCVVATAVVDHDRIDSINIYQATLEAMRGAFFALGERTDLVLVDGDMKLELGVPVHGIVSGDALSFSIACASIVAKVTRDRLMMMYHERYPQYGFDRHKGYGTVQHLAALREIGPCPIHRRTFTPVRERAADGCEGALLR